MQKRFHWWRRSYTIALVVLLAALVRIWAAWQLPIDADEPVYMNAGQEYARLIQAGDFRGVIDYVGNREHPALVKMLYSIPYYFIEPQIDSYPELTFNRILSVVFGTLAVWLVALADPLAGLLLAMQSMTIKYTSEAYLEAIPLFTATAAVLALDQALRKEKKHLFWLSAIALGFTAASKYTYLVVLLPLAVILFRQRKKIEWSSLFGYALVALAIFIMFDPTLWANPVVRLWESLSFHADYTSSYDVLHAAYPWYQPLLWVMQTVPWHPKVFFFFTTDEIVFFLGLAGLYWEYKRRPWSVIWFLAGFAVLLVWRTKWPQYTLIIMVPLAFAAATFIRRAIAWAVDRYNYWGVFEDLLPHVSKKLWALVIFLVAGLTISNVVYEIHMAIARHGWMQLTTNNAPLTSDLVNDLYAGDGDQMAIATNHGVTIWTPGAQIPWGEEESAITFTKLNSGLSDDRVLAVIQDGDGDWWFGNLSGLDRLHGSSWQNTSLEEMGLAQGGVQDLEMDSQGHLWVGTLGGVALWDGEHWQAFTTENSGLLDNQVFSVEMQPSSDGDVLWFGSFRGISRLETSTNNWQQFDLSQEMLGWRGVSDILLDGNGKLWAATLGGGLGEFDGQRWTFQRKSNSHIPFNTLTSLYEFQPGILWVGFGYQTEPGGIVATYDGEHWTDYGSYSSGYSDFEPQAFSQDSFGRLWIATSAGGIDLFQIPDLVEEAQ
jgi:hypothetical protein